MVVKVRWAMARGATRRAAATAERWRNMAGVIGVERRGERLVVSFVVSGRCARMIVRNCGPCDLLSKASLDLPLVCRSITISRIHLPDRTCAIVG